MKDLEFPTSCCRLGLARGDITPPVGIYHRLWGAAAHDRATGVHRPLTATALVLHPLLAPIDPWQKWVLLALDHCLLWAREMEALLAVLTTATSFSRRQIAVTFSHTHSSGLLGLERGHLPGGDLIGPYLDDLARQCSALIQQADQALAPATITHGQGRCSLAAQRDFWDEATGQFVCGFNPAGQADDIVLVARITGPDRRLIGTLVNYACHPTTLAWQNTLISPDYPGAMRAVVEAATEVPCVFFQGSSGDLGPREGFVGDVSQADRNGRQLGHAALAALEAMPPPACRYVYQGPVVSGATLGTWAYEKMPEAMLEAKAAWVLRTFTVELPYRPDLPGPEATVKEIQLWREKEPTTPDARAMIERLTRRLTRLQNLPAGAHFPMPVSVLRLGDAFWVSVEGELYQEFQRRLRRRFPRAPIWVATLTNGSRCSYLPTADTYGKGIYQESIAVLAPGCLETLEEQVARMMASL